MNQLKLKTEFSFLQAYGPLKKAVAACQGEAVAIADTTTFGHVPFFNECKKQGKKPILGVQLPVVATLDRVKQPSSHITILARNNEGLQELYQLASLAASQQYYTPRILPSQLETSSNNLIILSGMNPAFKHPNLYLELNPGYGHWNKEAAARWLKGHHPLVITSDVYYPTLDDRQAYEILVGQGLTRKTTPQHILQEWELEAAFPGLPPGALASAMATTNGLATLCTVDLPEAPRITLEGEEALEARCQAALKGLGLHKRKEYQERVKRELALIAEKGFEHYFYMVADMVRFAKASMLVGPGRGSAAGSLVCWLLGITEVDPLQHGLLFERFIDVTRMDLPDIDLDFPDVKREQVISYLVQKYGSDHVSQIGTVSRYKPDSAINEVAKLFGIPLSEVAEFKKSVEARDPGDARASLCIQDALESDLGQELLGKYPHLGMAAAIEGHARHHGKHAAGILVCNDPLRNFATIGTDGAAQMDMRDAEKVGLLKVDVLGLRTLTVLECCLEQIGKDRDWLVDLPLEDEATFNIFNAMRLSGIFQFEGAALASITRGMGVESFTDLVAITTIARPGPLHAGGAEMYVKRRTGQEEITYTHPALEPYTSETYGIIIYQEQIMKICQGLGKFSDAETTKIRKAMGKSQGEEAMQVFWHKFKEGCTSQGILDHDALAIWRTMITFGSYAFNKSHAVSYAILSFWCAYLKAHHPLEFALACLRNEADSDKSVKLLRELALEGIKYVPFDPFRSQAHWSIQDGALIGGLTAVKGIGEKMAQDILVRRSTGKGLTPGQQKLIAKGETDYDKIFEGAQRFGHIYEDPAAHNLTSQPLSYVKDMHEPGQYLFLARIKEKILKDKNDPAALKKRGGRRVERNSLFLSLVLEDDSDLIYATITSFDYSRWGKDIWEKAAVGDWYVWRGEIKDHFRRVLVDKVRRLEE